MPQAALGSASSKQIDECVWGCFCFGDMNIPFYWPLLGDARCIMVHVLSLIHIMSEESVEKEYFAGMAFTWHDFHRVLCRWRSRWALSSPLCSSCARVCLAQVHTISRKLKSGFAVLVQFRLVSIWFYLCLIRACKASLLILIYFWHQNRLKESRAHSASHRGTPKSDTRISSTGHIRNRCM